ncbi:MAG: hypothetical protein NZ874_06195 [Fimbriimonadales bacterium]|nr:hypothetical protein [Fimbriimonadales bacterium]
MHSVGDYVARQRPRHRVPTARMLSHLLEATTGKSSTDGRMPSYRCKRGTGGRVRALLGHDCPSHIRWRGCRRSSA